MFTMNGLVDVNGVAWWKITGHYYVPEEHEIEILVNSPIVANFLCDLLADNVGQEPDQVHKIKPLWERHSDERYRVAIREAVKMLKSVMDQ